MELCGGFAVAGQTEGAEIVEVALTTAFGHGPDVVGIPKRATAGNGPHPIEREAGEACRATGALQSVVDGCRIGETEGTDTVVAGKDLVTQVSGV